MRKYYSYLGEKIFVQMVQLDWIILTLQEYMYTESELHAADNLPVFVPLYSPLLLCSSTAAICMQVRDDPSF